jgi:hypothetical protein
MRVAALLESHTGGNVTDDFKETVMQKRLTDSFVRQTDGRWTCIEAVTLNSPARAIQFRPGMTWGPEDTFMGMKVAKLLDSLVETRRAQIRS